MAASPAKAPRTRPVVTKKDSKCGSPVTLTAKQRAKVEAALRRHEAAGKALMTLLGKVA